MLRFLLSLRLSSAETLDMMPRPARPAARPPARRVRVHARASVLLNNDELARSRSDRERMASAGVKLAGSDRAGWGKTSMRWMVRGSGRTASPPRHHAMFMRGTCTLIGAVVGATMPHARRFGGTVTVSCAYKMLHCTHNPSPVCSYSLHWTLLVLHPRPSVTPRPLSCMMPRAHHGEDPPADLMGYRPATPVDAHIPRASTFFAKARHGHENFQVCPRSPT